MKMTIFAALAFAFIITKAAGVEILSNYNLWSSLPDDAKAGVMIGMTDEIVSLAIDDTPTRKSVAAGIEQCLIKSNIKAGAMANAVEAWYRVDVKRKSMPVSVAFFSAVTHGVCKNFVDIEIQKQTMSW